MRLWFWCYFLIVVGFLLEASPVYFDGAGPMPSWSWTDLPGPGLGEYYARLAHYRAIYLVPYVLSGLLLTLTGLSSAPRLVRRLRLLPSRPYFAHFAATLTILVGYSLVSDLGSNAGLWRGPVFFLHDDAGFGRETISVYAQVFLPAPCLSGFAAFVLGSQGDARHAEA